jgi:hypothetical protein
MGRWSRLMILRRSGSVPRRRPTRIVRDHSCYSTLEYIVLHTSSSSSEMTLNRLRKNISLCISLMSQGYEKCSIRPVFVLCKAVQSCTVVGEYKTVWGPQIHSGASRTSSEIPNCPPHFGRSLAVMSCPHPHLEHRVVLHNSTKKNHHAGQGDI